MLDSLGTSQCIVCHVARSFHSIVHLYKVYAQVCTKRET